MAYEALDILQQTLDEILKHGDYLIITPPVKQEIVHIRDHAVVLQLNLKHLPNNGKYFPNKETIREAATTTYEIIEYLISEENISDGGSMEPTVRLANQLSELAEILESTARDVVDYINSKKSVCNVPNPTDSPAVSSSSRPAPTSKANQLRELAEKLKKSVGAVVDYMKSKKSVSNVTDSPAVSSSSRPALTSKDVVVGFEEDLKVIKDRLLDRSSGLQVLPIVGTGGIGKTTLAKLVYNDAFNGRDFEFRAWITVSQDYSVASIVSNLLAFMNGISEEKDVEEQIREYLRYKRYLIVIDDLCSKKAWDDIKMLFPNSNGSWIILTTRLQDVAAYVDSSGSMYMMRLLDAHHSWKLLEQKVFSNKDCPLLLKDIGKKIVKDCGGLPLAIVVAAGILSKIPQNRYLWKKIAANDAQLETIISLSYTHLPDYMKACFLYMAGFPEDYEIRVSELINLWTVEGFVKCSNESKSLEEEAEDCLEDLVQRNLVLVSSRKLDGKIKSCSLHDMVRDFCVRQGGKKKLILSVMDYLPSPILRRHFLPRLVKDYHIISATSYDLLHLKDSVHSSHIRTIICIPKKGYRSVGSVEKFSSLRVLHVFRGRDDCDWEAGQVFDLIHLTYLASDIPSSIVPSTISKLQNLETLNIYRFEVSLPVEIWRLRQLRHLTAFSFDPLPHPEVEALPLENLQTLSQATDFVCSERMAEMIPNIRKLGICYSRIEKFDVGYHLDNLQHLRRLEKLKLEIRGDFLFAQSMNLVFPLSLKRLTLNGWELPWSDMTIIGRLPNLQVLKLRDFACSGRRWETIEGEFVELRLLLIDESDLVDWITESSHFPRLEYLMLSRCYYLSELPINIGDIPTLKLIEVDGFSDLWYLSNQILEKQRNSGNDNFQVRLKRS